MSDVICDLGQGLVLRRGRAADAEALAAFNADVLRGQDATEPNATMAAWTRDLFTGRHPTFTPDQATVVEHRPSGTIVSSVLLVSQIWSFGGLSSGSGSPSSSVPMSTTVVGGSCAPSSRSSTGGPPSMAISFRPSQAFRGSIASSAM